jgi:chromosome segregation ATPase
MEESQKTQSKLGEIMQKWHEKIKEEENMKNFLEIKESQKELKENVKTELEAIKENQTKTREMLTMIQEQGENRRGKWEDFEITYLKSQEKGLQKEILQTLLEFKFEYLGNESKNKTEEKEEPIDIKEEFRAIHSENLMTKKRIMSDCHTEVVHPLMVIQSGIERNLTEKPSNTRKIMSDGEGIEEYIKRKGEEERERLDNITKLATLSLVQTNENQIMMKEVISNIEDLKATLQIN